LITFAPNKKQITMNLYVVLVPVDSFSNARKVCELIETQTFGTFTHLNNVLNEELVRDDEDGDEVTVLKISDFMDAVNDQELDNLTNCFISYVNIEHPFV
jgi:hypothetical protein